MHFSGIQAFFSAAGESVVEYSRAGYLNERADAGIEAGVCMGLAEASPHTFPDKKAVNPMTANLTEPPPGMFTCLGINPHKLDDTTLLSIRNWIKTDPSVVGFKIYAGYYHFYVHDPVYDPIYRLAAEHALTVAIHTGVTYSEQGIMEYSHPLTADRLAVKYRDTLFLLCHLGNPWIMDACEVAYKNRNVYLDMSGLVEGNVTQIDYVENQPLLMQHYTTGLVYLNNYKKVLFGTDWPIVPMKRYVDFCKKLIPAHSYNDVFRHNAIRVYKLPGM